MSRWLTPFLKLEKEEKDNGSELSTRSETFSGRPSRTTHRQRPLSDTLDRVDLPLTGAFPLCDVASLTEAYEERIAIAYYDGQQTLPQAQRIAYMDAFIAVFNTLPHTLDSHPQEDWLRYRIVLTQKYLSDQGFSQPQ